MDICIACKVFCNMKKLVSIYDIYLGLPKSTMKLLPLVISEHFIIAFCLNIAAFFKKIEHLNYGLIGEFVSFYYWGCLFGVVIGGTLTLYMRTTKITGYGLLLLCMCLYQLLHSTNLIVTGIDMFALGCLGAIVSASNITSLIRSVNKNESIRLKVISFELVLFNLCYSIVTFVLLDLGRNYILYALNVLLCLFVMVGTGAIVFYKDSVYSAPEISTSSMKFLLPENKKESFILMSMIFCFGLIFSMVKVVFNPTLIDRFGSNMLSVTAASVNPWVLCIFQPLLINYIKNTNSVMFLGFGGFLVGFCYFVFGLVNSFSLNICMLVLLTFGEMMFSPLSKHYMIRLYKVGQEGIASSVWRIVFLGSGIVGSEVSGVIASHSGSLLVWKACAFLGLICFMISLLLRKMKNQNRQILMA